MRLVPRRLAHSEEATLVEHLEELRQRIFVCLAALLGGFAVAYGFHNQILHWLNRYLKGEDPVLQNAAEKLLQPEQLRVFRELPADQKNTRIHESFVPSHERAGAM